MKVLQISKTRGHDCGIALFADNLQKQARRAGIHIENSSGWAQSSDADLVLLHHHDELFSDGEVSSLASACTVPIVLFAHSDGAGRFSDVLQGFVAMCPGMIGPISKPVGIFPHPAWVPNRLEDRASLRMEFKLPQTRPVVGTNGFLKFERQFAEIAGALLPEVRRNRWFLELITSPWRLESRGVLAELESLRREYADCFRFEYTFLESETLNRRLQSCDLLWCWTAASSSPYGSGVIADQYASGTRIIAADKLQHAHILGLPNTVVGPAELLPFVRCITTELAGGRFERHDPFPVSWENWTEGFRSFLEVVLVRARRP
jgi:hypothetical protein